MHYVAGGSFSASAVQIFGYQRERPVRLINVCKAWLVLLTFLNM